MPEKIEILAENNQKMVQSKEFKEFKKRLRQTNNVLSVKLTDDIFPKYYPLRLKERWKRKPLQQILHLDRMQKKYNILFQGNAATHSIAMRLVLKLRGEDYMTQANTEIESKPDTPTIEEIKKRSEALDKENEAKKKIAEHARKFGWSSLTLGTMDKELSIIWERLKNEIADEGKISKLELAKISAMLDIKKDKFTVQKYVSESSKGKPTEIEIVNQKKKKKLKTVLTE